MFELKSEQFSGPIDKLLELIEERKMEITQLSMAQVTADFLNYLSTIETLAPGILADFLVVASRLLLIKSKALLPNLVLEAEEEQDIKDLENRLKMYQEFKAAKNHLKDLWREQPLTFSREFMASSEITFFPPEKLKIQDLEAAFGKLLSELQKFVYETKNFKVEVINLEEEMRKFLKRLEGVKTVDFGKLAGAQPKAEIITYFLVILHLIKDQMINVSQNERFSEMIIEKTEI